MKRADKKTESSKQFSPRDFMRARRPELYSDTTQREEVLVDRHQLEFYLNTLTSRKEELRFEHFCRRLAEKEICPNLLPQTGPTGGGDSKVDSETYPVSEEISLRWYVGEPKRAASERWAFAFSAMKSWPAKFKSDLKKIAETERGYTVVYFMTNQAVRDKYRAKQEDELSKKYGFSVRILDRTWMVEKVISNRRWDVIDQTLDLKTGSESRPIPGPLDAERIRDLEELELLINDSDRYGTASYQLIEDSLQSAVLARGLNYPRTEIDGRFARAERIAKERGSQRQLLRVLYQRAWTANFWFDDYAELNRVYEELETIAINSDSVWDLDKLSNLWHIGIAWDQSGIVEYDKTHWAERAERLREAFVRHEADGEKKTGALWAKTQIVLMEMVGSARKQESLAPLLRRLNAILKEIHGRLDYPVESIALIIQELGDLIQDDESYDELNEFVIQLQCQRISESEQGLLRLERGFQLLKKGKKYSAIDQIAKAQFLLAKEEQKEQFVQALVGTALSYESAGLMWAARGNLIFALDRIFSEYVSEGTLPPHALPLVRKLVWVELQLGRVTCVFVWLELLALLSNAFEMDKEVRHDFEEECQLMDAVLGILIFRTRFDDVRYLDRVPQLLERMSMPLSRGAALFCLGYEDKVKTDFGEEIEDLDDFVSKWLLQPAAKDLPVEAEWNFGSPVSMQTALMGCQIELLTEKDTDSIVFAEALLGFFEAFFSTAISLPGLFAMRDRLTIEIRVSQDCKHPFENRIEEDDCGETKIVVSRQNLSACALSTLKGYQDALLELLTHLLVQLHVAEPLENLEELFSKHRAQDRAYLVAKVPVSVSNVLNSPKYHLEDWIDNAGTESFGAKRSEPWVPSIESGNAEVEIDDTEIADNESKSFKTFGVDALRHRDLRVMSPINFTQWAKAGWCGVASLVWEDDQSIPDLALTFKDPEAPQKIFRGWRKRVGEIDAADWIGITVITGIDKRNPAHYRVAIGVNEGFVRVAEPRKGLMASVFRMKDVTPEDSTNIDRFLKSYEATGRYRLLPGLLLPGESMPRFAQSLAIEKKQLRVVPAWQIGSNEFLTAAMDGIVNPIIPPDVENAPILELINRPRRDSSRLAR